SEAEGLALSEAEGLALSEAEGLALSEAEGLALSEAEGLALPAPPVPSKAEGSLSRGAPAISPTLKHGASPGRMGETLPAVSFLKSEAVPFTIHPLAFYSLINRETSPIY
ncbi:MAG: hypothetical protein KKG84_02520, partial [Candidatus Omnitrophica bacterium]|nr:hypothetical protein [Candidatus Omnitrophota bacterium]